MVSDRSRCDVCEGFLRRGRPGGLCDPYARKVGAQVWKLPEGFYDRPKLKSALARYDFPSVFIAVRLELHWSQQALGARVGMSQQMVSAVELGHLVGFPDARVVPQIANGLGIPPRLLGFTQLAVADLGEEERVDWMDRRNFDKALAAILMGVGVGLELDRLRALLPPPGEEPVPRRIGAADVAAIEAATSGFRVSHYQYGGGLARAAAVAQLGYVLRLREAQCSEQVRAELLIATAALANTAGWMSVECGLHEDARKLSMVGLDRARQAEHPHSTDLMVEILMNTAQQARHLGQPREALDLIRYADNTMAMSKYQVSAPTRQRVQTSLAVSQATLGRSEACVSALEQAAQTTADIGADQTGLPPWAAGGMPAVTCSSQHGRSMFLLSRTEPDYAPTAINYLRTAIDGYGAGYANRSADCLPALAGSYVQAGDLDAAVTIGHEAVTVISGLSSTIPHPWLGTLAEVTKPHNHRSDIAELRHRIHEVLAPPTAAV